MAVYSHSSKNRRIASIEASKILSWPASHLSTVERDTPSSREISAFFHFDRSAKVRKRIKSSAISRSLHSFCTASISLGIKGVIQQRHTELNEIRNSQQRDIPSCSGCGKPRDYFTQRFRSLHAVLVVLTQASIAAKPSEA